MQVVHTIAECRAARAQMGRMALVPTMGAFHAGHISLMEIARRHAPHVAVSIFVNPTQFGPNEDFSRYPRPIESDLEKCRKAGADLVFNPSAKEMYPSSPGTNGDKPLEVVLDLPSLTTVVDGAHRPGHFRGVCQVVAKLFNIFQPNVACFGQKDFQQLRVISAMVEALDWGIEIVPCPTLRESDGLAMSSRNQYLSAAERERALAINRGLRAAEAQVRAGQRQTAPLLASVQQLLLAQQMQIDYVAVVDPMTLRDVEMLSGPAVLAVAARVGKTRLIDNLILNP